MIPYIRQATIDRLDRRVYRRGLVVHGGTGGNGGGGGGGDLYDEFSISKSLNLSLGSESVRS